MSQPSSIITKYILLPLIPFKAIYYWKKANTKYFPGREFARFGFQCGLSLLRKGTLSLKLLFNPVSIVRYFEFDFAFSNLNLTSSRNILDVSSPYLFGFFVCANHNCSYTYINPNKNDLNNVLSLAGKFNFMGEYSTDSLDATILPYSDNSFDYIISISVIEHIADDGDSKAMREMWRVLKPGGELIITLPVKKIFEIEYRDSDVYNLNTDKNGDKYFFQRIYDADKIKERLLSSINNFEIVEQKVFGETLEGFYNRYKIKWIKYGYWETVKDPYYIANFFNYFSSIDELVDMGVMGLRIKKSNEI
jgi:ubiquinone/menaquinone biosynthesis C-methylase UbiE